MLRLFRMLVLRPVCGDDENKRSANTCDFFFLLFCFVSRFSCSCYPAFLEGAGMGMYASSVQNALSRGCVCGEGRGNAWVLFWPFVFGRAFWETFTGVVWGSSRWNPGV